ncbi:MAG: hypothetical protein GY696_20435, partial [Gammaproteobacteria bacterium]|nr:hypothetical protein [Gammaproteobacteria bacterium]
QQWRENFEFRANRFDLADAQIFVVLGLLLQGSPSELLVRSPLAELTYSEVIQAIPRWSSESYPDKWKKRRRSRTPCDDGRDHDSRAPMEPGYARRKIKITMLGEVPRFLVEEELQYLSPERLNVACAMRGYLPRLPPSRTMVLAHHWVLATYCAYTEKKPHVAWCLRCLRLYWLMSKAPSTKDDTLNTALDYWLPPVFSSIQAYDGEPSSNRPLPGSGDAEFAPALDGKHLSVSEWGPSVVALLSKVPTVQSRHYFQKLTLPEARQKDRRRFSSTHEKSPVRGSETPSCEGRAGVELRSRREPAQIAPIRRM